MSTVTGTITAQEAARLIRAVAKDNFWRRGKKGRLECWKNVFGIYVNVRFKDPRYSIEGRSWRADFAITGYFDPNRRSHYHDSTFVKVPWPNMPDPLKEQKPDLRYARLGGQKPMQRSEKSVKMILEALHGEDAYNRDMLLLRMFESEWESIEGKGLA